MKKWPIRVLGSPEGGNLVVFYYPYVSEIWPNKRGPCYSPASNATSSAMKKWPIRVLGSLERGNLIVFY